MEDKLITIECPVEVTDFQDEEAFASVTLNKNFNYLKFVLTDTKANANKQRVPKEEFQNLINTGISAPFKMAYKRIKEGHSESYPLGSITHLKEHNDQILAIAALWPRERPDDVDLVKQAYSEKRPLNVSWEILYKDSDIDDEGIETLRGTSLRGVTLVGLPAYEGRTPVIAFASTSLEEEAKLEELEQLMTELADAKTQLESLQTQLNESQSAKEKVSEMETELTGLREYKASVEKAQQDAEKLTSIKEKFTAAGVEKADEYFEENKERFIGMGDNDLDFFLQELVAFSSQTKTGKESVSSKIPPITGGGDEDLKDPKKLAEALREHLVAKK